MQYCDTSANGQNLYHDVKMLLYFGIVRIRNGHTVLDTILSAKNTKAEIPVPRPNYKAILFLCPMKASEAKIISLGKKYFKKIAILALLLLSSY